MKMGKIAASVIVGGTLLLGIAPAQATPIPDRVGARFDARAHIGSHSYSKPWHTVNGTVTLVNKAGRGRHVNCEIPVQFKDANGDARIIAWGDGLDDVFIGANRERTFEYTAMLKDAKHRWANVPVRANAHCRVVQ